MPKAWSDKAVEQQIEVNRAFRALATPNGEQFTFGLMPTLVKANETIMPGQSGYCSFLKGTLHGSRTESSIAKEMYNLVSDATINPEDICLAQRVMLQESGDSGWVVMRVKKGGTTEVRPTTHACKNCSGGEIVAPMIKFENLEDLAAKPQFNGWAQAINGVHTMEIVAAVETGSNQNCKAVLEIEVPYNVFGQQQPGNALFTVEFLPLFNGNNVVLNIGSQDATSYDIQFGENLTSWPTNQFPRDGVLPICESTYSDWKEYHTTGLRGDSMSTWISTPSNPAVKITLNPSQS